MIMVNGKFFAIRKQTANCTNTVLVSKYFIVVVIWLTLLVVGFAVIRAASHPGLWEQAGTRRGGIILAPLAVDQHIADVIVGDVPVGAQVQSFW